MGSRRKYATQSDDDNSFELPLSDQTVSDDNDEEGSEFFGDDLNLLGAQIDKLNVMDQISDLSNEIKSDTQHLLQCPSFYSNDFTLNPFREPYSETSEKANQPNHLNQHPMRYSTQRISHTPNDFKNENLSYNSSPNIKRYQPRKNTSDHSTLHTHTHSSSYAHPVNPAPYNLSNPLLIHPYLTNSYTFEPPFSRLQPPPLSYTQHTSPQIFQNTVISHIPPNYSNYSRRSSNGNTNDKSPKNFDKKQYPVPSKPSRTFLANTQQSTLLNAIEGLETNKSSGSAKPLELPPVQQNNQMSNRPHTSYHNDRRDQRENNKRSFSNRRDHYNNWNRELQDYFEFQRQWQLQLHMQHQQYLMGTPLVARSSRKR
eukprot:TRINITY_DN4118_c0_g1_i1.p1 TRINITY_DN4118_c0_g1~~TRINITY_DN4118_c0_g1_i1.p1  ORF type:complete len:370 (-),score=57.41 TRINITY_DN4118_c0_g1_i1:107-1216(-)